MASEGAIEGAHFWMSAIPRGDGTPIEREGWVRQNFIWIGGKLGAEARAVGAGAFMTIKGEVSWGKVWGAVPGFGILGLGRKSEIGEFEEGGEVGRSESNFEAALAKAEGEFNGIGEASLSGGLKKDSIDDEFEGVGIDGEGSDFDELVFMACSEEPFFFQAGGICFLKGGKEDGGTASTFLDDLLDDFLGGGSSEGAVGVGRVRGAIGGKENAKVVVDLGGGGKSGSGGAGGVMLFDCEGGGEAFDGVDGSSGETFKV